MSDQNKLNYINLIGGEKGGVGKTFTSRSLCQYLTSKGVSFALVEADSQINDVGRIYSSQAQKTETIRLSDDPDMQTELDVIIDLAIKHPVLVNLPSNTLDVLENWIVKVGILKFMQEEYDGNYFVKWFVSDGCHESIRQLERSINQLDNAIPHILVLNEGRLIGRDFGYLEDAEAYQRIKKAPNFVAEVTFPAMESAVQYFIDSHELTLEQAIDQIQDELGILAKQRVKTFIDDLSECFDKAFAALGEQGGKLQPSSNSKDASRNGSSKEQRKGVSKGDQTATEAKGQKVAAKG